MKGYFLADLQKNQRIGSYLDDERKRYNKLKINIVLISTILGVCVSVRLSEKKDVPAASESSKQHYYDAPAHRSLSKFNHSQIV